ncbi:tyrosine-type recombinase/integrase [Microtetraspora fusca]|uniref:Tyrosine-type recombinase/integrase n=1 Tax=Microtetraspora fusca TaxID=1997 RepID=A0ABW6VF09_MICFU
MTGALDFVAAAANLPAVAVPAAADPYQVYLSTLGNDESRRTMKGCLDRIARLVTGNPDATGAGQPWHQLTYGHTVRIAELLRGQGWSASHVNKHLSALRRVMKEAWKLGLLNADDYARATNLPYEKGETIPAGDHIPPEVLGAVLLVCDRDDSPAGRRDSALLAVLYSTGCRRAEVARVELAHYRSGSRSIQVTGKGNKQRLVYLTTAALARLEAWLAIRGRDPGPLFQPINKSGKIRERTVGLSGEAISDIITRRFAQAKVGHSTPHDFRRTFIGELLDAGVDLATTQALVGHESPATTARYDRRPERRRQEAVDRITLPRPAPLVPEES